MLNDIELKCLNVGVDRSVRFLAIIAAIIVALDLAALAFALITGRDTVFGLLGLLDLDKERGVGMLFQVLLLLSSAILLRVVATAAANGLAPAGPWKVLAAIFFFLTLDEFAFIHERLMPLMRELVGSEGILYFAWIIPYGVGILVLALWLAPQIFRLKPEFRNLMLLAAFAYVGGALGMEALGGWRMNVIGGEEARPEFVYEMLTTVEETLEMTGLILFVWALLRILQQAYPKLLVRVTP